MLKRMILYAATMMFVDLKTVCETILGQHRKERLIVTSLLHTWIYLVTSSEMCSKCTTFSLIEGRKENVRRAIYATAGR